MTDLEFVAELRGHCEAVAKGLPKYLKIVRRVWGDEAAGAEAVKLMEARPLCGKLWLLDMSLDSLLEDLEKRAKGLS